MNNLRFRKKPVVIEAFRFTEARREDNTDWPEWLHEAWNKGDGAPGSFWPCDGTLYLGTLEGAHVVAPGDWIIRGVKGELYPCKPDIFDMTYEAA